MDLEKRNEEEQEAPSAGEGKGYDPSKRYVSKEGFEEVPLLRGFTEIKTLFSALQTLNVGAFICGGYARYCASPKPDFKKGLATDVDIYSPTEEAFAAAKNYFVSENLDIRHENEMAITYKKAEKGPFRYGPAIQLIKPVREGKVVAMGSMQEILENFDFTVVRAAILSEEKVLVDADFMHDEEKKILRLKNIHCPVSSTLRCMKYAAKGYWLPIRQAMALFLDWDSRNDEYRSELVDFILRIDGGEKLTQEEMDHLELLMRRD